MNTKTVLPLQCQVQEQATKWVEQDERVLYIVGCRNWQTCPPVSGVV